MSHAPERQDHVVAAEAEGVVEGHDGALRREGAGLVADDVRADLRVQLGDVDRRRGRPVLHREDRRDGLDAARAPEEVAGHRLGRGDRDVVQLGAEDLREGLDLADVAQRRRRRVRVGVHDLGGVEPGRCEQVLQGAGDALAGGLRGRDVVAVGRDALAQRLRVDRGTALRGVLGGLQDHDTGTLAEHEAVTGRVEGARGALGVLVVLGHRHHVGEGGDGQRVDRRLGAARDDDVGTARTDHLDPVADRLGARGTGGDGGVDPGAGVDGETHVGGGPVGHEHRHGVRGDAAYALLLQHVVLVQEGRHAADAGGDHGAEAVGVDRGVLTGLGGETGVLPRLVGRDQRELGRAVQFPRLRARQDLAGLDEDAGGDLDRQLLGPLLGEGADAGAAGEQAVPGRLRVATQRCGCADTGDDHGAIGRAHRNSFSTDTRDCGATAGRRQSHRAGQRGTRVRGAMPRAPSDRPRSRPAPGGAGRDRSTGSALVLEDVIGGVADGLEVLDVVVGDLDVEALLGGDDDLDHGQRVDVQVIGEGLVQLDVLDRDTGDLVHDLGETGDDLFLSGGHVGAPFVEGNCYGDSSGGAPPAGPCRAPSPWLSSGNTRGRGRTRCLGEGNDRRGEHETRPEADEKRGVAALRLAGRQHPLHRERNGGGRGVAGGRDIACDLDVLRQLQGLHHRVDDPHIGLVRDEDVQVLRGDPGGVQRLLGDLRHLEDGPAEDRLTLLGDGREPRDLAGTVVRPRHGLLDDLGLVALGAPDGRAYRDLLRGPHDDRARTVAEEEGRRAVLQVGEVREPLHAEDEHVLRAALDDHALGQREPVAETGAARRDVEGGGLAAAELVGDLRGDGRGLLEVRDGRDDDRADLLGRDTGVGEGLAARLHRHRGHRLVGARPVPALDARARTNPLVRGVDRLQDDVIGDDAVGPVAADAQDARVRGTLGGLYLRHLTGLLVVRAVRGGRCGVRAAGAGFGGQAECSATSARAASRSSGDFSASVATPGRARLARPVSVPPGQTSIRALAPCSLNVSMHRSQRTGLATWPTSRSSTSPPVATTAPSLFDTYAYAGSDGLSPAAAFASTPTAGAMCAVWKAPATWSGTTRRTPSGLSSASAASCAAVPAATTWPPPLTFAGVRPSFSRCGATVARSPPSSAAMPVSVTAAASAIASPRVRTSASAASESRTPAKAAAVSSPTLCPATAPGRSAPSTGAPRSSRVPASAAAESSPAATSSGWATAVSRIASASARVP
ncbi:putative 3-oxoacyl-ACP synthase II [Streptomyces sp. Tu6071]|nr:putative 3-oxoacyl-ACP synthase II [Streptomyces sp. Tu6071]